MVDKRNKFERIKRATNTRIISDKIKEKGVMNSVKIGIKIFKGK